MIISYYTRHQATTTDTPRAIRKSTERDTMWYGSVRVCNITRGIYAQKLEAESIEEAWQKVEDNKSGHEEMVVFPLNEGT